jgi:hypothetical protein
MENYAWTLTHQFGSAGTLSADRMHIGLFKRVLARDPVIAPVINQIESFADWEKEVKERRNPAAHRMPLCVPSAALTPEDAQTYERLGNEASAALHEESSNVTRIYKKRSNGLGRS